MTAAVADFMEHKRRRQFIKSKRLHLLEDLKDLLDAGDITAAKKIVKQLQALA